MAYEIPWIFAKDELPEKSGRYLVYAFESSIPKKWYRCHTDDDPYSLDTRICMGYYSPVWGWDAGIDAIAWAHLPEPPKVDLIKVRKEMIEDVKRDDKDNTD